jgi:SAM-dependent methyltransferase
MDHHRLFDEESEHYAAVRPQYPKEIFEHLASVCSARRSAWDSACGNGQAAVGLARFFERVEATDIGEQQIAHALKHPRVTYSVQSSEETDFADDQFNLVCVAQALHWFDHDLFWPEVKRVLEPEGIFAAWGYSWFRIEDSIDEQIQGKLLRVLEPYWPSQVKLLWDHYRSIPFPFERLEVPSFEMTVKWDLNQLFAYIQSWSAVRLCLGDLGRGFLEDAYHAIQAQWGEPKTKKKIDMDFCMLLGRNVTDKI